MSQEPIFDFNILNHCSDEAFAAGAYSDALDIFLLLASLDPTLEAGFYGFGLAKCYEKLGDIRSAKFWAQRAVAENPTYEKFTAYAESLEDCDVGAVVQRYIETYEDRFSLSKKLRLMAWNEGRSVWPRWQEADANRTKGT